VCWRAGFPRGLFPPLWCFPPRCLGAVAPPVPLSRVVATFHGYISHCAFWRQCIRRLCHAGSRLAQQGAQQHQGRRCPSTIHTYMCKREKSRRAQRSDGRNTKQDGHRKQHGRPTTGAGREPPTYAVSRQPCSQHISAVLPPPSPPPPHRSPTEAQKGSQNSKTHAQIKELTEADYAHVGSIRRVSCRAVEPPSRTSRANQSINYQNPQRATHAHTISHIPAPPHGQQTLRRRLGWLRASRASVSLRDSLNIYTLFTEARENCRGKPLRVYHLHKEEERDPGP